MVGMTHRYRTDVEALKRFIEAGRLGRIYHARTRIVMSRSVPRGWFRSRTLAGGGALWDTGVHALDLAWYLMNRPLPTRVSGHVEAALPYDDVDYRHVWTGAMDSAAGPGEVEDFASAMIRFADGATLLVEVAWAANFRGDEGIHVEIFGTEGGAELAPPRVYSVAHRVLTTTTLEVSAGDPFPREMAHFLDVVRGEAAPRSSAAEGAQVVRMLDAVVQSSAAGREVELAAP
jgi:predicted dehydrogenase